MKSQRTMFRVLHVVARRPVISLLAMLVAVAPLAMAGSALRPDNSLSVWFVRDDPALVGYRAFVRQFGNDEVVAIAYRAPGDVLAADELDVQRRAAERLRAVDGIDQVLAPVTMADSLGRGAAARAYLRRTGLISDDGRTATLLARMSARPDIDAVRGDILDRVRATADSTLGAGRRLHYAGIGVVYDALNRQTIRDSGIYLGIAFVVMAVLLWVALRRWQAVLIAIVPPVIVSVMTTGLFAVTGRPFTQVTAILPMLVLVIGLSDAIHLVAHYYTERRALGPADTATRREMVARATAWVAVPNLFTALTTAAGFLALASSRMPAIRDLGLAAAAAMLIGWVLTLVVGTAALAMWDVQPPPERARAGAVDRALAAMSIRISRHRWIVLGGVAAATAVLLVGAARVRADTYTLELLPPAHVARSDSRWIEQNAGFYTPLEFVVRVPAGNANPAGVLSPDVLRRVGEWQRRVQQREDVARTFGVADLALARRAVPGGAYVSADRTEARVTAFVPMTSTRGFAATVRALEAEGRATLEDAATMKASGYLPLYLRIVEYVVSGTIWGLAISTVIVFAMVGLLLRSLSLTAAAVPTNLFPVALVFGIMGWTGIPLDIATATIGAIVLGISVDDTIHFLFRYREERAAGRSREDAVAVTYRETGRAVVFASLVLAIGFAVLATSSSQSIAYFGIVSSVSILGAMLADLFLLPVLLLFGRKEPHIAKRRVRRAGGAMSAVRELGPGDGRMTDFHAVRDRIGYPAPDEPVPPSARCLVAYDDADVPVARLSFSVTADLQGAPGPSGLIGHYESVDSAAALEMLRDSITRLRDERVHRVLGPMNGSTWGRYRLALPPRMGDGEPAPPFLSEPWNPPAYVDDFVAAGLSIGAEYESAIVTELATGDPRAGEYADRLRARGVTVRPLALDRFDDELRKLFELSVAAFADNPFYSPIEFEEFRARYTPLKPLLDPEMVRLAEDGDGRLMGYVFAFPDLLSVRNGRPTRVVLKTLASAAAARGLGLGTYLTDEVRRIAHEKGYAAVIHALMQSGNASIRISRHSADVFRRYALFEWTP